MKCSECGKTITSRKKKYYSYDDEYLCSEECVKKHFELTEDVCSFCGKKITNGLITDVVMHPYCSYECAYKEFGIETIEKNEEPKALQKGKKKDNEMEVY